MKNKIRKAIFPVAGLGTRFYPATKATPKEMIPIIDKPLIQYAVEEAIAAGITTLIFISGGNKRAIEDHFDTNIDLENKLITSNKHQALEKIKNIIPDHVNCVYIRQSIPLGLGHAVACAAPLINDEPFAVLLADELVNSSTKSYGLLKKMCDIFNQQQCSIIAVGKVPKSEVNKYGIIEGTPLPESEEMRQITQFIEKPKPEETNSDLAIMGRYILTPNIIRHLQNTQPGVGGEIQLTDALVSQLNDEPFISYEYKGPRYDCGSKIGYLLATLGIGLEHPEYKDTLLRYIKEHTDLNLK